MKDVESFCQQNTIHKERFIKDVIFSQMDHTGPDRRRRNDVAESSGLFRPHFYSHTTQSVLKTSLLHMTPHSILIPALDMFCNAI